MVKSLQLHPQNTIVTKLGIGVDSSKRPGSALHELTRVNLKKLKKIFEILIFHTKKIKKQSIWI
jgi:hypothetical protein